jgi:hypothetical protein
MPYVFGYQHIYPNTQDYYFIWRAVEQGQETLAKTLVWDNRVFVWKDEEQ